MPGTAEAEIDRATDHEPASVRPEFLRAAKACGWFLVLTGSLVFIGGWWLDVTALKNLVPGTVVMKASTATALALAGASLVLLSDPSPGRTRRLAGLACATYPLLVGLAFLSEYVLGWDLGIDEFPFRDEIGREQGIAYPGRLAPTTAVCLVLVALALFTLNLRPRLGWRPAEAFAVPVVIVASMSLIGYTYAIPEFYGPASAAKMALNTAACFVAVAIGIVLARPHGRLLDLATTDAPGGMMARRLIPVAVLLPLLLGWLRLEAGDAGVFNDRVGTWWLTAATIVGLLLLLWRGAVRLNKGDRVRRDLEQSLFELANHDQMTGLFNRHRFEEELAAHAHRTRRSGGSTSLMVLDLDRLKHVNDQLGHAAGDALIRRVADEIARRVRVTDVVGRLGGDEFGVLLADCSRADTARIANELAVSIARPDLHPEDCFSTVSIGTAFREGALAGDGTEFLAEADTAMYSAKRAGGDRTAAAESKPALSGLGSARTPVG